MAYQSKTWKNRAGTGLNKYKDSITGDTLELINTPDSVTEAGDAFSAANMNDLESRIAAGFADIDVDPDLTELLLNDNAGNTLDMQADGSTVIDTTKTHPAEAGATLGVKMALANLATDGIMGRERGITFSMQRRLNSADQSYIGYLLTTGMLEIRYGTTNQLDNSGSGVKSTFNPSMSAAPQIVLLTPKTGVTGVAAPKVGSIDKTGFYATLGGSTGTNTTCYYLAIRFNYWPN